MGVVLKFDPYFDGNSTSRVQQRYGTRSANDEVFSSVDPRGGLLTSGLAGRPISAVLPTGTTGGKGRLSNMLLEPATEGGTPQGFHPNILDDVKVQIDPQVPGQSCELNIGGLRKLAVAAAYREAGVEIPGNGTTDRQRLRASATYHMLASGDYDGAEGEGIGEQTPMSAPMSSSVKAAQGQVRETVVDMGQPVAPVGRPVPQQVTAPAVNSNGGPQWGERPRPFAAMQAAAQPKVVAPTVQHQPQSGLSAQVVHTHMEQSFAPTKHVSVDLQLQSANGAYSMSHDAYFHDVIRGQGFLVMIWDTRCKTAQMFNFPEGENAPPTAIMIDGDPQAYLVQVSPVRYSHREFVHIVLVIENAVTIEG